MPLIEGDPAPSKPLSPSERRVTYWFAAFFGLCCLGELLSGYEPANLTVLFILLWWVPLLFVHELGHAGMAKLLGWSVSDIVIGFGRDLWRFRIGNTQVRIKWVLMEGYVRPVPTELAWGRLKMALIFGAGPAAEAGVLAVLFGIYGSSVLLSSSADIAVLAAQSLAVAIAISLISNLFPRGAPGGGVSDGLGMLLSWRISTEALEQMRLRPRLVEIARLMDEDHGDQALQLAEETRLAFPDQFAVELEYGIALGAAGQLTEGMVQLEAIGPPEAHPPATQAVLLEAAALLVLAADADELLPDACDAASQAVALMPEDRFLALTYGRVLFESERYPQALRALQGALGHLGDTEVEGRCLAFLAMTCQHLGQKDEAEAYRQTLPGRLQSPSLQRRVDDLMAADVPAEPPTEQAG